MGVPCEMSTSAITHARVRDHSLALNHLIYVYFFIFCCIDEATGSATGGNELNS